MKKKSQLQLVQEQVNEAVKITNTQIEKLGEYTNSLYIELGHIQAEFDKIRHVPQEKQEEYGKIKKICSNWNQQVKEIEQNYNKKNVGSIGGGAAGVGAGIAVVALGPTTAMAIATTFGVASTGTAISALSGAAATNAALAWLGGGALAVGGGGIAAGNAFLALAGPIGWTIAGMACISSGLLFWKNSKDKKRLENIYTLFGERNINSYKAAQLEIQERIKNIQQEAKMLSQATNSIKSFGYDYSKMTEKQQYEMGAYVNLMVSSTQLLVNPIKGLMSKYTQEDMDCYMASSECTYKPSPQLQKLLITLCNVMYGISLEKQDLKLLGKIFKKNKDFLQTYGYSKRYFDICYVNISYLMLQYQAKNKLKHSEG